jgi:hypothetical protein
MARRDINEELILALALGASVAQAAQQVRISRRTAFRRIKEPGFQTRVETAKSGLVAQAVGRLSGSGVKAAQTLDSLLDNRNPRIRLAASRATLEYMFRGTEVDTLRRRVEALEAKFGKAPKPVPTLEGNGHRGG